MLNNKGLMNLLINNLAIGLGLSFMIIGVFLLNTPLLSRDRTVGQINNINTDGLELNYNRLSNYQEYEEIELNIPAGSSGITAAYLLEEKGLISVEEFRKYIIMFDIGKRIRAGTYRFNKNDSIADILSKILIN
ncbi:hypothetical protein [Natronospora cellulosivora (SeqCode)]